MPKLSIIIPTFNSAASIEGCLRSIACQTFADYEIIVHDGGSSDATVEKIRNFQAANRAMNLDVFVETDKGPYDAMNKGVRRANGEWLYFLGSDDELCDANVLGAVFERSDLTNSDVVYGNVRMIGDASWAKNNSVYDGIFDLKKLLSRNICHQAIFYRAEFLREVGEYNINYAVCSDWDFNMRCWAKTRFRYVDIVVANFRTGGISAGEADERFMREVASNVLKYFGFSSYDTVVNTPTFVGFDHIVEIQQSGTASRRILSRIRKVIRPFRTAL